MDIKNAKVTIIIPTKNEIQGMKWFMKQLKKEWYDELIVIDGNSTDGTVEYCRENGYPVFIQSKKGVPNAYDEAFEMASNDIIMSVTPDGNSLPELIPELVKKIREGYDMVIASRYAGSAMSLDDDVFTKFGNKMFTAMINVLFGGNYTDTLVGFRAYTRDAIDKMRLYRQDQQGWLKKRFFDMNSWDPGSCIRAAQLKLKVCEIPGDEPKRIGGVRKLSIIRSGLGVLLQILYELMIWRNFVKDNNGRRL